MLESNSVQQFLNKKISLKISSLLFGVASLVFAVVIVSMNLNIYNSAKVAGLDCMTINRGYLEYVRYLYSGKSDFESSIWPKAIDVGGQINSLCYESINEGLIKEGTE